MLLAGTINGEQYVFVGTSKWRHFTQSHAAAHFVLRLCVTCCFGSVNKRQYAGPNVLITFTLSRKRRFFVYDVLLVRVHWNAATQ